MVSPNDPYRSPLGTGGASPYGIPTGGPPAAMGPKPQVILWQRIYLGLMVAIYALVVVAGVAMTMFADQIAADDPEVSAGEITFMGGLYAVIGLIFGIVTAIGFVFKRGTGGWVYNLVMICLGLTSCCFWPICIPLLVFWIKQKDAVIAHLSA